ncbi:DUF2931 family protein [Vibrio algivorus]|nr:DUF2931 family protein [Vibrio algivorus]
MIRQCKRVLLLLTLVSLPCAAFSKVPEVPKDKPKWRIGVTTPSFYNVDVEKAYAINEDEDWTSYVFSYSQLPNKNSLKNIHTWISNYDGFGIALDTLTILSSVQMGGTNHLPDSVYIHWTSMHDLKFYVTKFNLSPQIKNIMLKKKEWSWGRPCYVNDFMFGLLPNGHAKVWLSGCDTFIYIGELKPFKDIKTKLNLQDKKLYAEGKTVSSSVFINRQKQANELGESLFPIPWDKVHKVYWQEGDIDVYSLDDYNAQGDLINPRPKPITPKPKSITYRCWQNKPPVPNSQFKLESSSPQFTFLQLLWEYSPHLVNPVDNLDSTINDAWKEAKQQGLDEDHTQAWVLGRLVGLTDYPLDKLYKELKVSEQGQALIKQYVDQMCQ